MAPVPAAPRAYPGRTGTVAHSDFTPLDPRASKEACASHGRPLRAHRERRASAKPSASRLAAAGRRRITPAPGRKSPWPFLKGAATGVHRQAWLLFLRVRFHPSERSHFPCLYSLVGQRPGGSRLEKPESSTGSASRLSPKQGRACDARPAGFTFEVCDPVTRRPPRPSYPHDISPPTIHVDLDRVAPPIPLPYGGWHERSLWKISRS